MCHFESSLNPASVPGMSADKGRLSSVFNTRINQHQAEADAHGCAHTHTQMVLFTLGETFRPFYRIKESLFIHSFCESFMGTHPVLAGWLGWGPNYLFLQGQHRDKHPHTFESLSLLGHCIHVYLFV
ncbi:hypothetical protein XENOCAPTIV_011883 [Xenoophorus captivus]|uniref:Uncharacterized protein n=1 Tax=Xenoophorus captivus TaxID=1517983 RepID=A0ABV0SCK5_9TELE